MKTFQYSISDDLKSDYIHVDTVKHKTIDDLKRLVALKNHILNSKLAFEKTFSKRLLISYTDYYKFRFKIIDDAQLYKNYYSKNSIKSPKPAEDYGELLYHGIGGSPSYYDESPTIKKTKITKRSLSLNKSSKSVSPKQNKQEDHITISFFFEKTNKKQYYSFQSKISPDTKLSTIKSDIAKRYKINDEIILTYKNENTKTIIDPNLTVDDIKDFIKENYSNGKKFNIIYVEIKERNEDYGKPKDISSSIRPTYSKQQLESRGNPLKKDTKYESEEDYRIISKPPKSKQRFNQCKDDDDDDDNEDYRIISGSPKSKQKSANPTAYADDHKKIYGHSMYNVKDATLHQQKKADTEDAASDAEIHRHITRKKSAYNKEDDDDDVYDYLNYKRGVGAARGGMAAKKTSKIGQKPSPEASFGSGTKPVIGGSVRRRVRDQSAGPAPKRVDDDVIAEKGSARRNLKPSKTARGDDTTAIYDIGYSGMPKKNTRESANDRGNIQSTAESPQKVAPQKKKKRSASAYKPKIVYVDPDPASPTVMKKRPKSPPSQTSPRKPSNISQRPHKKLQQKQEENSPYISPKPYLPQKKSMDSPLEKKQVQPYISPKRYSPSKKQLDEDDDIISPHNSPYINRIRKQTTPSPTSSVRPHKKETPVDKTKSAQPKSDTITYYYQTNGDSEVNTIDLDRSATVQTMRQLIADVNEVDVENVKIIFAGKELLDDINMEELDVGDTILFVYIRFVSEVLLLTAKALRV